MEKREPKLIAAIPIQGVALYSDDSGPLFERNLIVKFYDDGNHDIFSIDSDGFLHKPREASNFKRFDFS